MTCTEMSSPTLVAVSAPASVAALTAPTSPTIVTETRPSPTCSRPTMVTLAALTMASPAASAATYPLVSINPIALSAIADFLSVRVRVYGADDQRVDGGRLAGEPGGGDRSLRDQHPLAHAAAEYVERDQPLAALSVPGLDLHLEERAAGQAGHAPGGPHASDHRRGQHQRSLEISTPLARARSLASGVSTAPGPSTSRSPARAASRTTFSVTAPRSMRRAGAPAGPFTAVRPLDSRVPLAPDAAAIGVDVVCGRGGAASRNRFRPARRASRVSASRSSSLVTKTARSSSEERLTVSTAGRPLGSTSR